MALTVSWPICAGFMLAAIWQFAENLTQYGDKVLL
jgi:hypothetical protein